MANVLIESQTMTDIANAIREKNGAENTYKPSEMPQAVRNIESDDTGVGSRQWWLDVCKDKLYFDYFFAYLDVTEIPKIDTSRGKSFNSFCRGLANLTVIPNFDFQKAEILYYAFAGCKSVVNAPEIDTSNVVNLSAIYLECISMVSINSLDTSKATDMTWAFMECYELISLPTLDFSNVKSATNTFYKCYKLSKVSFVQSSIKISISFAQSPLLNDESRQSIFDGLADLSGKNSQVLTLNKMLEEKITDEQKAYIVSKNWQLAFS